MKIYGPTMQCNIKTLDDVKFSNCQPMAINRVHNKLLLINCLINYRLSINQTLPQLINILHGMLIDPLL